MVTDTGAREPAPGPFESVMVSGRLPVRRHGPGPWQPRPGSLSSALQPVVAARRGAWVGWTGEPDRGRDPFTVDDMSLHPVPLSNAEMVDFLQGQCESTLAPLYHDAVVHPVFSQRWRRAYRQVNQRFAQAAADVAAPGAMVWVQGHHLQLVPAMLRRLRPDLLIGFFLHIPFPPAELFMQLPNREETIEGLLGADVIGFQRPRAVDNFLTLTRTLAGLHPGRRHVDVGRRRIVVDAFPQSVDLTRVEKLAADETVRARSAGLRAELGYPRTVLLAVDRLDPAKGIEQRLAAYAELLGTGGLDPAETVLIQVATPEDHPSEEGRRLRERVEQQVGSINGTHGQLGRPAVHYLCRLVDPAELTALYLAADVMLATPLRDGMNLTAKEYVAARTDHTGALVLSEFTGTADDLPQAITVNPHDVDAMKQAIRRAVDAAPGDLQPRMSAMRQHLITNDVRQWAGRFLSALGRCATPSLAALAGPLAGARNLGHATAGTPAQGSRTGGGRQWT